MKKQKPKIIQDKKQRGEWAESVFMARASGHGLQVSKPWGETNSYDFVVGSPGRFVSVQVKSTIYEKEAGFECTIRSGDRQYSPGSFDFLAAYAILADSWYIIPAALIVGKECIMLYPNSNTAKYEPYREAWDLLREAAKTRAGDQAGEPNAAPDNEGKDSAPGPAPRFPRNALERVQASMNFFRNQLERGGRGREEE